MIRLNLTKASYRALYIARGHFLTLNMLDQQSLMMLSICLLLIPISLSLTTTESSTVTTEKITTKDDITTTEKETTTTTTQPSSTPKTSTSPTSTTTKPSSSTTSTAQPQSSTEWQDIEEVESQKLVSFVVSEIQKLKVEHKELDECQELDLSSVLSGKKLVSFKLLPTSMNFESSVTFVRKLSS